ncbi:MAG: DUF488 family protein [Candidatus Bathyarchaeia archaeon]
MDHWAWQPLNRGNSRTLKEHKIDVLADVRRFPTSKVEHFKEGIGCLMRLAESRRICLMCKEVNPKYCHRRFIANILKSKT